MLGTPDSSTCDEWDSPSTLVVSNGPILYASIHVSAPLWFFLSDATHVNIVDVLPNKSCIFSSLMDYLRLRAW